MATKSPVGVADGGNDRQGDTGAATSSALADV